MIETLQPLNDIRSEFENCPVLKHYNIKILTFEEGNVKVSLTVGPHMINTNGTLHGGVYATLLDAVLSMQLRSVTKKRCVTTNLNIYYTAPVLEGVVYAEASIISKGYRTAFVEGALTNENDEVVSKGSGMLKIINK